MTPNIITNIGQQGIRVNNSGLHRSLLISTNLCRPWDIDDLQQLNRDNIIQAIKPFTQQYDIILLGCGKVMIAPPLALLAQLRSSGYSLEAMTTGAAARTYNLLISEERRPLALLIWQAS